MAACAWTQWKAFIFNTIGESVTLMSHIKKKPQKKWELKLQEAFPFMKRDIEPAEVEPNQRPNPYQLFGCECREGWYQLLHDLCQEITDKYAKENMPVDIVVDQVKEKFATLRFYYSFADTPTSIHAFDSLTGGGIRFYPSTNNTDEKLSQLRRDIADIVKKYENKSRKICEKCGKPGEIRKLPRIQTLCDGCYQNYLKTVEERKNIPNIH